MITRILMTAAMAALTFGPAVAQDGPGDAPLEWDLDTETLREALLAIGSLEPGDVSEENTNAVREMRDGLRALEAGLSPGPTGDDTLQALAAIGASNLPVTDAQLNALQAALTARVKATDATPEEAERAVSMLRILAEHGGVKGDAPSIDPSFGNPSVGDPSVGDPSVGDTPVGDTMAALAGVQGVDPADMEAALALLSNIATNGEQGEVFGMDAAIAADVRDAASAFGAYDGQTGNTADQQRIVSDILGGRNRSANDGKPRPKPQQTED